jgi:antitoxin component of RelBE/YafQ-DinJ toxin-antitoxin module
MKKTHVIQLRVDEDLYFKIVENADSMGLTVSSYVRFALLKFLKVFR